MYHQLRVSLFMRAGAALAMLCILWGFSTRVSAQGLDITIVAGSDKASSSAHASGSVEHVIVNLERKTFDIEDSGLKTAVEKFFKKRPNDAYVKSPTPWGDLYKKYKWPQVHTVVVAKSAEVLSLTSVPTILATRTFKNNTMSTAIFDASITDEVSNTASSTWSNSNTIEVGQKVEYALKFLGTGGKGETSFKYSHTWGTSESMSETVTLGTEAGVSVPLQPGETVKAILSASKGALKVRVTYLAYLNGYTAVNYNPAYNKHHFWALPISSVMKGGGLSNVREYTEDIEVGFYSNATVEVRNEQTNKIKTLVSVSPSMHR